MTPAELLARLCEVYEVANLNQLAQKLGYEASTLYRWEKAPDGPGFTHTMELLRRAGVLNLDDAPPRPIREDPVELVRELEEILARLLPRLREAFQGNQEPPRSEGARQ